VGPTGGGGGGIIKEGTGTLYLNAPNTYEGDTVVNQGRLKLAATASLNNASVIRVQSGGTFDVSDFTAGYTLNSQELRTAGQVDGSIHATNGSTLSAESSTSVINGNLTVNNSVVRIGNVGPMPMIVATGLQLNFDAAQDPAGDATWTNAATPGTAEVAFPGNASPVAVADATFTGITSAYDIPATGSAEGLNGYFELQSPARSRQDATFEVVFHVSSTTAGADQVLFEVGATRGVSFLLAENSLSFNVDGDGSALSLSSDLAPGWHHAVGVIDLVGSGDDLPNDSFELYVDNVLVGSQADVLIDDWAGGNITGVGGPASGAAGTATPVNYHGEIAVARYYNNLAFGEAEVTQNYQVLLGSTPFVGPAVLNVNGDFTQNAGSTLEIDLYAGMGNDVLTVSGTLTAGGTLDVSLVGPDPSLGESFQIFAAAAFAGAFDNINLPGDPADWNTSQLLIDGTLTFGIVSPQGDFNNDGLWNCDDINALVAAIASGSADLSFDMNVDGQITLADITADGVGWLAAGGAQNPGDTGGNAYLVGDANLDGVVDGQDFLAWNANKFASVAEWCGGDFTADGVVDGGDFIAWNANKFTSSDGLSAVPEPGTGLLTFLGLCWLAWASKRR
jgi:autotransporter-associated beta strand protein